MNSMLDVIYKKRDGIELSKAEIDMFVGGYTDGSIPDYQASALLMAIHFRGMSMFETKALANAMLHSGDIIDLSGISGIKVDKHSSGGVGDKTTLICAPIAAACGAKVPKMSGRGLGFTGGTIDKYESIPGFETSMSLNDFVEQINRIGVASIGQTETVAAADKKIYALRDVTATVDNLSLIAASIMSKKLASGSDAIVLDVKCGNGAFMKNLDEAEELADMMCAIGSDAGKKTVAVITDMNQPLGQAVGNSLECIEAIEVLKNKGPQDIRELAVSLAALMIYISDITASVEAARVLAENALNSGEALNKFRELLIAQGGDPDVINDYKLFKQPKFKKSLTAKDLGIEEGGFIETVNTSLVGMVAQRLGAGRIKNGDAIDSSAGIVLHKKIGDYIACDEIVLDLYCDCETKLTAAMRDLSNALQITKRDVEKSSLIRKIINI